jgi:hypothetical protein
MLWSSSELELELERLAFGVSDSLLDGAGLADGR